MMNDQHNKLQSNREQLIHYSTNISCVFFAKPLVAAKDLALLAAKSTTSSASLIMQLLIDSANYFVELISSVINYAKDLFKLCLSQVQRNIENIFLVSALVSVVLSILAPLPVIAVSVATTWVLAYFTGRHLGAIEVRKSRQEKRRAQVLNDYKGQMTIEVEEIDEIIMQLNYFSAAMTDVTSRLLENISNHSSSYSPNSRVEERSAVELPADFVRLQLLTRELRDAIKSYPTLEDGQKVSCNSLRAFCIERAEYHQKVKELAGVVFEETYIQLQQDVRELEEQVATITASHP